MPIFVDNPVFKKTYAALKMEPDAKALFETGKLDDLENLLLSRIDTAPTNLDCIIPVLRTLVRNQHLDRAATLLQILTDTLVERGAADTAMGLMHAVLEFWPKHAPARAFLCTQMIDAYGKRPDFDRAWKQCNPEKASDLLIALRNLELWFIFCEGTIVYLPGAGPGKVIETNPVLDLVRVHMAVSNSVLSFKLAEGNRSLTIIPPGHFLHDRVIAPQVLVDLAASEPASLLQRIFTDMKRPFTQNEIRDLLAGIIAEKSWTSWWNKVKTDKRLSSTVPGGKGPFSWNETESDGDAAVIEEFVKAPIRGKIEMAAMLGSRSEKVAQALSAILATVVASLRDSDPNQAFEAEVCRAHTLKDDTADPKAFLTGNSAYDRLRSVEDRILRKRAYALAQEHLPEWQSLFCALIRCESDAALIAFLFDALAKKGRECTAAVVDPVIASPVMCPRLYAWVVKEMPSRKGLDGFADAIFVNTLLASLPDEALRPFRNQLAAAFEPDGAAFTVIQDQGESEARRMLSYLERISGLDDEFKRRLIGDIHGIFPHLQENRKPLVAEDTVYCLIESLHAKQEELQKLVQKDLVHNAMEIKRTREYGDLRENFEYHAARARQELLSSMAKTLHDDLLRARVVDLASVDCSCVSVGTAVRLIPVDGTGTAEEFGILGKWESDPAAGILSHQAKAVSAMLGKKMGDEVEFNEKAYRIEIIKRWERQ